MLIQTDHEQIPFSLLLSITSRVGCRVVGFLGLSEKQHLPSGLQNYRVWSSGAISLSSQFSFTLPPPKLLLLNHLLINGVNNMRCWAAPLTSHPAKVSRTHTVIRRIWSNVCYPPLIKCWVCKGLQRNETSDTSTERFPWIPGQDKALLQCFKTYCEASKKKKKAVKTQDSQKAYTLIPQTSLRQGSSR